MNFRIILLFTFLSGLGISAQSIHYEFFDTLRYSDGSFLSPNTVLNDIDDDGKMIGYFENADGYNDGLLVLENGKMISYEFAGYLNTEITGINANGFVLGKAYNSFNAAIVFQASIVNDTITQAVELNWNDPNGVSKNSGKLNDSNIGSGTVRITTQNWLHYESIIGPFTVDNSKRYTEMNPSFVTFNTFGLGLNNSEKYTGWYLDGTNRVPFVFDGIIDTFYSQAHYPSTIVQKRTFLNDINDSNNMAVSYRKGSGVMGGTVAKFSSPTTTYETAFPFTSFQNFEIFGINNNNDVVGYYENPAGQKIGLYLLVNGPELDSFDFSNDALSFANDSATFTYSPSQFDYVNRDEYLDLQDSFYNKHIEDIKFLFTAEQNNTILDGTRNLSWPAFVSVREKNRSYITQNDGNQIPREEAIITWVKRSSNKFTGNCFGMSIFALQNLSDPNLLLDRFPGFYTPEQNSVDYMPSSLAFREMIAVLQLQQIGNKFSQVWQRQNNMKAAFKSNNFTLLEELMRPRVHEIIEGLKTGSPDSSYLLSLYLTGSEPGYHAVMPYKVTRKVFYNVSSDTLHCVDPNYPNQVLKVYVDYGNGNSAAFLGNNLVYSIGFVNNSSYLKDIIPESTVNFRTEGDNGSPKNIGPAATFVGTESLCDFTIENLDNPTESISAQPGNYTSSWPSIGTFTNMNDDDNIDQVIGQGDLNIETSINACGPRNYFSYKYQDGLMVYGREGVQTGEVDIVRNEINVMSIANPNASAYDVNFIALHSGLNAETMITVKDYDLGDNEVVRIETVDATHFLLTNDENDDKTYDLLVHYADEEELINVSFTNIPIDLVTDHLIVIQPEVENAEVVILVDQNQDGSIEDTLFGMIEEPTSIQESNFLEEFKVFPNPAQDILNIKLRYLKQGVLAYNLENIFGQVILADKLWNIYQNDFTINVSDISPGIYFLNLKDDKGLSIGKRKVTIR